MLKLGNVSLFSRHIPPGKDQLERLKAHSWTSRLMRYAYMHHGQQQLRHRRWGLHFSKASDRSYKWRGGSPSSVFIKDLMTPPTWTGDVEGTHTDFPVCVRHRRAPRCGRSSPPAGNRCNVSPSALQARNLKLRHKSRFMWTVKTIRWEHFNGILPHAVCAKPRPPTASAARQSHINPRARNTNHCDITAGTHLRPRSTAGASTANCERGICEEVQPSPFIVYSERFWIQEMISQSTVTSHKTIWGRLLITQHYTTFSSERAFWLDKRHSVSADGEFNSTGNILTLRIARPYRCSDHLSTAIFCAASKPNVIKITGPWRWVV